MDFESMLQVFAQAVADRDARRLAGLFTPDGRYHDGFFGTHQGRDAIAAMIERFHVGGEDFAWQFVEPLAGAGLGYARYCFSYRSREAARRGELVVFDGMARFQLRDGLIADYTEVFDRGVAFTQLGYDDARVIKLLGRYTDALRAGELVRAHVAWRERQLSRTA